MANTISKDKKDAYSKMANEMHIKTAGILWDLAQGKETPEAAETLEEAANNYLMGGNREKALISLWDAKRIYEIKYGELMARYQKLPSNPEDEIQFAKALFEATTGKNANE